MYVCIGRNWNNEFLDKEVNFFRKNIRLKFRVKCYSLCYFTRYVICNMLYSCRYNFSPLFPTLFSIYPSLSISSLLLSFPTPSLFFSSHFQFRHGFSINIDTGATQKITLNQFMTCTEESTGLLGKYIASGSNISFDVTNTRILSIKDNTKAKGREWG